MLSNFLRAALLALPLIAVACGGSESSDGTPNTGTESSAFASVAPATGQLTLASPHADHLISGFVFANEGTTDISLSDITVTLADGTVIPAPAGLGLPSGGGAITFSFDTKTTHLVSKLSFSVDGSTAKLVVTEDDHTGIVPAAH